MAPSPLQQRRTHNTLLFQKLLNLREGASPFTLVLDTLEQGSGPVIKEFASRAKVSKSKIIFVSFSTLKKKLPFETDFFIPARNKALASLRTEVLFHIQQSPPAQNATKYLIIIDNLHTLSAKYSKHLSTFLSSLLILPQISLLATYHADVPLPHQHNNYQPDPLTTLTYLATAILSISSLPQVLVRKRARDKSLQEPSFGLQERREGIVVGLKVSKNVEEHGAVINMEIRRRSGRGVVENFVLLPPVAGLNTKTSQLGGIILLDEHPLYLSVPPSHTGDHKDENDDPETTFSLGLTEKQKRDRENVVLPYFDAQKDGGAQGPGDGGRILYEMGSEDREDFDDEEDEI